MNTINFSNSRAKFDRIWSGKAYTNDLAGDTPKEKTKAEMWYFNEFIFKRKR